MKDRLESNDKLITDILRAEQIVDENLKKAESDAEKTIEKATKMAEGLREKSVVKLKNEIAKLDKAFEEEKQGRETMMQENSKAEISKLTKKLDEKKQEIAAQIVKEILTECQ